MCLQKCKEPHRLSFPYPLKEVRSHILPGQGTKETRMGSGEEHGKRNPAAQRGRHIEGGEVSFPV